MEGGSEGADPCDTDHVLLAGGTGGNANGERFGSWTEKDGGTGEQADAFATAECGRMEIAIITDGAEAAREDVAQVAFDKLPSGHGFGLEAFFVAVLPEEGDGLVGEGNDAMVADDAAGDVSAEIPDGVGAGAGRLDVDAPFLGPDSGIDLPATDFEEAAEMVPECASEEFVFHQVIRLLHADDFACGGDACAGDQEVQMRMELHLLAPGVEDGDEAADKRREALGGGEFFGHRGGHGRKEQIVELFGKGTEEAGSQFLRQRESHHKVGSVDLLLKTPLDPGGGGGAAAARAGFVIAAVESEVVLSARRAGIARPSHGRSAAMGDGPDGAALGAGERRVGLQKLRQETQKHLGDGGPAP